MKNITLWHNPRCSKSRQAFALLEESGVTIQVVKYLEQNPTEQQLKQLLEMLGFQSAKELMRTNEDIYKELQLKDIDDEQKLIEAMVKYPKLIQRPIVIKEEKAIIARPPETVIQFLQH
jgi:arsenate reductase